MCKQTVRVVSKQVERQGGFKKVAPDIFGMAVDRALHSIDTIGMVWNGMDWRGVGGKMKITLFSISFAFAKSDMYSMIQSSTVLFLFELIELF